MISSRMDMDRARGIGATPFLNKRCRILFQEEIIAVRILCDKT